MDAALKYSLIEKLVQTEDDHLLNQVKELLESHYEYSYEHQQLVNESLEEYRRNPQNTSSWEEVKGRILNK